MFVVGLDWSGEFDLATAPLRAPLGLGLRHGRDCSGRARSLRLGGPACVTGALKSLNLSAAALAFYIAKQRELRPYDLDCPLSRRALYGG